MTLARMDLTQNPPVVVEDAAPWAAVVAGQLPPSTWDDLTERGYPGVGYWPIVTVVPSYDPSTQALGSSTQTVDTVNKRVVDFWTVVPFVPTPQQQLLAALAQGVMVTSASTSALNGTYTTPCPLPGVPAANVGAQANIASVSTRIANNLGLPGGQTTFNYYDADAGPHAFDQTNWTNFAKAVSDYSYNLQNWYLGGAQGNPPSNQIAIA